MGREYLNLGTKVNRHKTSRCIIHKLTEEPPQIIEEEIDSPKLILKEPYINSIIPEMCYQIKRLLGYLKN